MEARARGLDDRYWEHVSPRYTGSLRELSVQMWVPMDVVLAHYAAMDKLALPRDEVVQIGRAVGDRFQKGFLGHLVRTLRAAGTFQPTSLLTRLDRVVARAVDGGAVAAWKVGLKDALIEHRAMPLARYDYVRAGWEGMYQAGMELVVKRVFVREQPQPSDDSAKYLVSWV